MPAYISTKTIHEELRSGNVYNIMTKYGPETLHILEIYEDMTHVAVRIIPNPARHAYDRIGTISIDRLLTWIAESESWREEIEKIKKSKMHDLRSILKCGLHYMMKEESASRDECQAYIEQIHDLLNIDLTEDV